VAYQWRKQTGAPLYGGGRGLRLSASGLAPVRLFYSYLSAVITSAREGCEVL